MFEEIDSLNFIRNSCGYQRDLTNFVRLTTPQLWTVSCCRLWEMPKWVDPEMLNVSWFALNPPGILAYRVWCWINVVPFWHLIFSLIIIDNHWLWLILVVDSYWLLLMFIDSHYTCLISQALMCRKWSRHGTQYLKVDFLQGKDQPPEIREQKSPGMAKTLFVERLGGMAGPCFDSVFRN